jgi:predicted phage-related endonuclease
MAELVCGTDDREAWLAARRTGVTATDIAVILGLVTWDSPFALHHRKQGDPQ